MFHFSIGSFEPRSAVVASIPYWGRSGSVWSWPWCIPSTICLSSPEIALITFQNRKNMSYLAPSLHRGFCVLKTQIRSERQIRHFCFIWEHKKDRTHLNQKYTVTFIIELTVRLHNGKCTEKANCNIDEWKDNHVKEKTSIFNVTIVMQSTQSRSIWFLIGIHKRY